MVLSKRERTIVIVTVIAVVLLVLDQVALSPIREKLDQLRTDEKSYTDKLANASQLFQNRKAAEDRWNQMIANGLKFDVAATEEALDHAVLDWARSSGLSLKSCTPERMTTSQRDLSAVPHAEVVLYVVGTGNMDAVSHFLFAAQTSRLPVQPEDVEITARREAADDLNVTLHISGLYFPSAATPAAAGSLPPARGPGVAAPAPVSTSPAGPAAEATGGTPE